MKKLHIFNDWYSRLPMHVRFLVLLPAIGLNSLNFFSVSLNLSDNWQIFIIVVTIVMFIAYVTYIIYIKSVRNALYYQSPDSFKLKIKGKTVAFETKHISEISLIQDKVLQFRRINRVDSFDLSHIRKEDHNRLIHKIQKILYQDIVVQSESIVA